MHSWKIEIINLKLKISAFYVILKIKTLAMAIDRLQVFKPSLTRNHLFNRMDSPFGYVRTVCNKIHIINIEEGDVSYEEYI